NAPKRTGCARRAPRAHRLQADHNAGRAAAGIGRRRQSTGRAILTTVSTTRRPALGTRGMVATPHHLATEAGLAMLQRGGSAVDAVIAANAVLTVVYPHMAGLGGDAFIMIWDAAERSLVGLNAAGRAAAAATPDAFASRRLRR